MIYLDNSATTAIYAEVVDAMLPYLREEYGNPSSKYYALSQSARQVVEDSRASVAALINADPSEIIFTSGSTESSNMIIKGVADYQKYYEQRGNHLITSKVEHHATLNTCMFLNGDIYSNADASFSFSSSPRRVDRGFEVSFLDVNQHGQVSTDVFELAIRPTTTLASFIWANNEIGSLNDIYALAKVAHSHGVLLHTDATQLIGRAEVDVKQADVDFLSMSAHKFHGPKGIGAAYFKSDDYGIPPVTAFMHGGEQENGIRAGTIAVHNIVGMGKAAELTRKRLATDMETLAVLDKQAREIVNADTRLSLLGDPAHRLCGVLSIVVNIADFNNERFIRRISSDFAVSTGSACTAGKPSHVLKAIGLEKQVSNVLRVSFSPNNSIDDFIKLISKL